jgi:hypothetical protein
VAAASPARIGTAKGQSSYSPFENNKLNDSTIAGFLNIAHELDDRTAVLNGEVQSLHQMMYDQKEEITRQNKERDERDRRFKETLNRIAAAQSKPAQAEMIRPPVSTPPHASSQYARTGGPPVFAPRAIPDTAPRPDYNFNFPQASRTRVPTISTPPMQFEHPVRPSSVTWDSKQPVLDAWDALVAGDPYQVDLIEDSDLGRNSPLACDVLIRKSDHSFAIGATGYSQESACIAWDRVRERQEGMDTLELSKMVTRAYVQKQGDQDQAGINVRNLWEYAHMLHEVNDRFLLLTR